MKNEHRIRHKDVAQTKTREDITSQIPTSFPGSLILPPPGATEERPVSPRSPQMRDPRNEVGQIRRVTTYFQRMLKDGYIDEKT